MSVRLSIIQTSHPLTVPIDHNVHVSIKNHAYQQSTIDLFYHCAFLVIQSAFVTSKPFQVVAVQHHPWLCDLALLTFCSPSPTHPWRFPDLFSAFPLHKQPPWPPRPRPSAWWWARLVRTNQSAPFEMLTNQKPSLTSLAHPYLVV